METVQLDWRGMRCPEPILKTARHIRKLKGGPSTRVRVLADDEAFPLDIKRWCQSSGVRLGDVVTTDSGFEAMLFLGDVVIEEEEAEASVGAKSEPTDPRVPAPIEAAPSEVGVEVLDCTGMACPEPIMKTARLVRKMAPGRLDVLADDAAFSKDIESWIKNSSASLIEIVKEGDVFRARLEVGERTKRAKQPESKNVVPELARTERFPEAQALLRGGISRSNTTEQDAPALAERARRESAPKEQEPAQRAPSALDAASMQLDLGGLELEVALGRVASMCGEEWVGEMLGVRVERAEVFQKILAQCSQQGHAIVHADSMRGELLIEVARVEVEEELALTTPVEEHALAVPEQKRATYLVIHNDFESLMAAMMVANTAAAQGMDTTVFFSFWGVNLLRGDVPRIGEKKEKLTIIHRLFRMMMPKGPKNQPLSKMHFGGVGKSMMLASMKQQNVMSLERLVQEAVEGGVRFQMCTMSMNIMGIHRRDIVDLPNIEFAGVASFVADSVMSDASMVF